MKRALLLCLIASLVISVALGTPGCRWTAKKPAVPLSPAPTVQGLSPTLYFPIQPGLKWEYQGTGNEFASFTNECLRAQGDLAQFRTVSGTTTGSLFSVTNDAVTRLARKELAEDRNLLTITPEEKVVLLKAPVVPGTSWANGSESRSIVSIGSVVDVPAGSFQDVVKVQVTTPGQTAQTFEYYARNIGLIKSESVSGSTRIVSDLKLFSKGKTAVAPAPAPAPAVTTPTAVEAKVPPVMESLEPPTVIAQAADSIKVRFRIIRSYNPMTPGNRPVQTSDTIVLQLTKQGGAWMASIVPQE